MYQITRLPSGLVVATTEMPHRASVSLGLWVGVGGRYEPAELNGVSHFIEHLLFKGTPKRSAKEISQAVEGIGGYLNAFTGEESTCFYSKARRDRFDELLDVLSDMFLNSKFDPVEIQKERGVIKEELAMYLDQPQHQVQELHNQTFWPNQPLGRPLTGTEKTLDSMGRAELVICAGLDTDNVFRTLKLILRELRRLTEAPPAAAELRRARDYVIGQIDLSLESTESQMMWLGEQLLGHGKLIPAGEIKRRLAHVTAGEVRAVARDFFRPERLNLALVSPLKSVANLSRALRL